MKLVTSIATALLLATPTPGQVYPEECLAKLSALGVCMGVNWQSCTSCYRFLPNELDTPFDSFCDLAKQLQCELSGCCLCSPGELTKCVLENAGEDCGDIQCDDPEVPTPTQSPVGQQPSSLIAEDSCGFCPGDYDAQFPDATYGELFNETLTCGELDAALREVPDGTCVTSQEFVILEPGYPTQCGYCVSSGTSRCTICSDGSIPTTDSETVVNSDGETCGVLAYTALYQATDSGACADIRKIGDESCGCLAAMTSDAPAPTPTTDEGNDTSSTSSCFDAGTIFSILSLALVSFIYLW